MNKSPDQLLSEYASELNQFTHDTIDYNRIADCMRFLAGCGYVMLDKFDQKKKTYTTVSLQGVPETLRKAVRMLGFEIVGQQWEYNPERKDHKGGKVTFFNKVAELEDSSMSPLLASIVDRMLNLSSLVVVKSLKDEQIIGDFTLMFRKGESLQNRHLVELYADMVGMTHARIDAETELRNSRDQLSSLVTNVPGMVYQFQFWPDGKSSFPYASEQIREIFGIDANQARQDGDRALANVHPDDRTRMNASIQHSFDQLNIWELDFRVLHPEKGERWIWGLSRPERQPDGSVIWHGYAADYTERKRLEEDLRKARTEAEEASKAKSQFLASMSHEIRTPLNGVIGFTDLLAGTPLSAIQQKYVDNANTAGKSLLEIVNSILDLSKIEAGRMELECLPFDLIELIEELAEMVRLQARNKGLELRVEIREDLNRQIISDPGRLRQILLNLLGNAIKFTEKGSVVLRMHYEALPNDQAVIRLEVTDTGIGITEDQRKRLFHAFSQGDASINRKYGGTGLGLVISRLLTDLLGGQLTVDSEPGKGSTFAILLEVSFGDIISPENKIRPRTLSDPADVLLSEVAGKSVDKAEEPALGHGHDSAEHTVLVAEDIEMNMLLTRTLLKRTIPSVRILEASNGAQAVQLYIENRPEFVLMDVQMPGMDGLAATRAIRKHEKAQGWKPIPIVALTAGVLNEEREECLRAGMDHFLSKPIDLKSLRPVIHSLLTGQGFSQNIQGRFPT
jgi:signal transduction histidine kinase/CheY-like chemotaxis protein